MLITNLANRVQPILRYDLGDSVLRRPDPCPCGNPLPAVRAQGRVAGVLRFGAVDIAPLTLNTLVDRVPGIEQYQLVQTGPGALSVRLRTAPGADDAAVWREISTGIGGLLGAHGLAHVTLERAGEPPRQSPGGKYRTVIPLEESA